MPRENYCHNCRWWQPLTDGVHCSWCLSFFYQHGRMPTMADR